MKLAPAALVLAAAVIASPAAAAPAAPAKACFRTQDMHNHTKVDDKTIYVAVGISDVWRITTSNACFSTMMVGDPLVIKTTGSTGMVCDALDLDLGVHQSGGGITSPCIVSSVTKLSKGEAAAIPKKLKP